MTARRLWFSPIRDQGSLNSCTAFAAIALLEYLGNRNFGKFIVRSLTFPKSQGSCNPSKLSAEH
ncbi:hypothetical protein FJSC11DRAFT_3877 [Fischerella thermalis JSC-11]|jgi:C1A family cysteine protease|uniref:Peptidase C1A papain C-terminal domain-containing protein n=1 Tax=Fischerella thermalis JSC-11 TaxID=741277 RepID=G6FYC8_9CYAN|nr:hypothetical protein FJSC11DRAFT_3877 [Fischerella thermalis JSC-11]